MSCVNVISRGVGMLPLHVYERHVQSKRAAKTRAHDHYMYDVLRREPNCEMTSSTFFKTFMCHVLLWGNGYAEITRRNNGQVHSIWPRNPYLMVPKRLLRKEFIDGDWHPQGTLVYETTECFTEAINEDGSLKTSGAPRTLLAENVIHVPGLTLDGRIGQSTVWMARQIIGLALASEKYSAKFFGNGAVPRGILEVPEMPEEKALEELRRQWHEAHGGENAHKIAVMTAGMKFTPIAFNAEQSQLLETRKFQRGEIAAMFNVPGHMVGDNAEKGKSNVEQSSIEFLTYTLMPWLISIEQEFERKVFPDTGQTANKFFPKFDTHLLKYPDSAARTALFNGGKQWGWLNTNDIHEFEDMNPVTDGSGEKYWMPTNMQDASDPVTLGASAQADYDKAHPTPAPTLAVPHVFPGQPSGGGNAGGSGKVPKRALEVIRLSKVFYPSFSDAIGRVAHRNGATLSDIQRIFRPTLISLSETIEDGYSANNFSFINDYCVELHRRSAQWKAETKDSDAQVEVRLAVENFLAEPREAEKKSEMYIMRHGQTPDDVSGVWSGWDEVDLTPEAIEEVQKGAQALLPFGIKRIVTSHLRRSVHTAQIVADVLGNVPVVTDMRLAAWNLGILAKQQESNDKLKPYVDDPVTRVPGGESLNSYMTRFNAGMNSINESAASTGPVLVVTHSSGVCTWEGGGDIAKCSGMLQPASVAKSNGFGKKLTLVHGSMSTGDAA